jgi:hypothetical protein
MMLINFIKYLEEAKKEENSDKIGGNSAAILHELLTGYHLNNKQHMEKHADINGLSPKQAHDKLKENFSKEQYNEINKRAKFAADDIRKKVGENNIARVHWTSKPGDIKRSTGVDATQKEDPSDIMITTKNGKHVGISLKTSDKTEHVPIANPGIEALHGADHILEKHRDNMRKNYSEVGLLPNARARKDATRANPALQEKIREENRKTLSAMSTHLQKKLSTMSKEELVHHLREHILHAHKTPLQNLGHIHMRHTTWGKPDKLKAKSIDPSEYYEHILQSPEHIEVHTTGQGVTFSHRGIPFARQNIKFDSQDDPMSSVKSATQDIPMETKVPRKKLMSLEKPIAKEIPDKKRVITKTPQKQAKALNNKKKNPLIGNDGSFGGVKFRGPNE